MMQNKLVIGLTGGIGSGKSTVSQLFEKKGVKIIDGDTVSRIVVLKGSKALAELENEFGKEIIDCNGNLDRDILGQKVFNNNECLASLNKIITKYIVWEIDRQISEAHNNSADCPIIIDGALLFEMELEKKCRYVIGVYADYEDRLQRIIKRNNYSLDEAKKRLRSQNEMDNNLKKCDFIVNNIGSIDNLESQVNKIYSEIIMSAS